MSIETRQGRGRFAPSTTGRAHPGTLLAALLCWLDARSRGDAVVLRLEDLDRERTKDGYVDGLCADFEWFGLDWDAVERQSDAAGRHAAAIDALAEDGLVYACECSRAKVRATGRPAPDGSHAYPGTCRARRVLRADWRGVSLPLRLALPDSPVELRDESGVDLSGDAAALFGDPILRRRDGATAYHLASILDDAASDVRRVVRGRDLMPATLLQVALQRLLGLPQPTYRHHLLFLEQRGEKLSKLHGAVDAPTLRTRYAAPALCGAIAAYVGLVPPGTHCAPSDLVSGFAWDRVATDDVWLAWDPERGLRRGGGPETGRGEEEE
ncbi:MAG: glutamate--tRNA ligase family protein [Myxococcota bacterium]